MKIQINFGFRNKYIVLYYNTISDFSNLTKKYYIIFISIFYIFANGLLLILRRQHGQHQKIYISNKTVTTGFNFQFVYLPLSILCGISSVNPVT